LTTQATKKIKNKNVNLFVINFGVQTKLEKTYSNVRNGSNGHAHNKIGNIHRSPIIIVDKIQEAKECNT